MPKLIAAITAGALAFTISLVSGGVAQAAIAVPATPQITSFSSAKNGSTQSIQVNFINPNDSSIVGYKYSTDGGRTFESCQSSACDWLGSDFSYVVIQKLSSENNSMSFGSMVNILLQACQAGTANTNSLSSCSANSVIYEVIVGTPDAPTSLLATSNDDSQSVVSWTAPTNDGGGAITDYTVEYSSDSGSTWTSFAHTASVATSQTVTGLINGTSYLFKVAAINSAGIGNYSATVSATPAAPVTQASSTTTIDCPGKIAYTGSALTPCAASVTGDGGLNLTDLTPTYSNNINAGAATASYTYDGDTNYSGSSSSQTFIIAQATSSTTISCNEGNTYTGSPLTPCTVSVTGDDGLSLTPEPIYLNNTNAGTATASYTYTGDDNHEGSSGSTDFVINQRSGNVSYTGTNVLPLGSKINLTASSDFLSYCPNNLFKYEYSADGTNWSPFAATGLAVQSPTTSTLNLLAGTYFIRVVYNDNGSGNCARAASDGSDVITVYAAGTNAYGGGFYTMNGKANFGFVVQLVPKTMNTYKGQVVWNYKNNWRFKGNLSNFGKGSDAASASGTGTLQYWDPNLVSIGVGGWAIAATNVNVIIKFTATKATTKKSAATTGGFVINFGYATPSGWQFAALPTVNTITALKGGNITYN
jgi:hypothetical protein